MRHAGAASIRARAHQKYVDHSGHSNTHRTHSLRDISYFIYFDAYFDAHKFLSISRLENSTIVRGDRCSETMVRPRDRSFSRNMERNIPLSGNAWSIGLDRNPNRLRMDHGIPFGLVPRHSDVRPECGATRRWISCHGRDGCSRRMDQSAARAFVLT